MIITVTERGGFKRCRRQWDYASFNRQALEPVVNRPALTVGSLVHAALADWMVDTSLDVGEVYLHHASEAMTKIKERYKDRIGAYPSRSELVDVTEQMALGHRMVQNYVEYWGSPLPEGYTLLQPEQQVMVPIPFTACMRCTYCGKTDPRGGAWCSHCYGGDIASGTYVEDTGWLEATFDSLVIDDHGTIWILERKTFGARPKIEVLNTNDQFLAYDWAATQLDLGPVGGVLYDGLWKRDVQTPTGRKSKYGLSDLFIRTTIVKDAYVVRHFGDQVRREYRDMENPLIYPNRRWEGCFDCAYSRLCDAETLGEDFQYVRDTFYSKRERNSRFEPDEGEPIQA